MPGGGAPNVGISIQDALEQLSSLKAKNENFKQIGNEHKCYKSNCEKTYPAGYGDICPHCSTDQNLHEAGILKWVSSKQKYKSSPCNLN